MSIFAIQVWIPGQFFKVIHARSCWFEASFLWQGLDHHNGQFQFMMGIVPFGRLKPLSARQQWVPSRPDFTSTCPEFILDPGGRPVHLQCPSWAEETMLAIEMLAGDINFVQMLHLSFSSPAAPGEPSELLTPQTPFLSIWGRRITNAY